MGGEGRGGSGRVVLGSWVPGSLEVVGGRYDMITSSHLRLPPPTRRETAKD